MNPYTPKSHSPYFLSTRQYGGTTLLFVLIMLLIVSIIGVSSARNTLMQERMSSNTNIHNIVFEAAESALAEGEARVANTKEIWKTIPKGTTSGCYEGVCTASIEVEPRWMDASFWSNNVDGFRQATEVIQINQDGTEIKIEPKYTIEDLGQTMAACDPNHIDVTKSADCPYLSSQRFFRVVGFARNKNTNTEVTVQSMYLDPRSTRTDFEAMELPPTPKYLCEDGKEYIKGISTCCPDSTGKRILQQGTTCQKPPEICNGEEVKSGQKCCDDGPQKYIHTGDECPEFCGPNRDKYLPSTQKCCEDANKVEQIVQIPSAQSCPQYCDGQMHDGSKKCCEDTITKKESLQDVCPLFCGNENIGWTAGKPGDNDCCNTTQGSIPFNDKEQKCCDDAKGIKGLMPLNGSKNCPSFCGTSRQLWEPWNNQGCCGDELYDTNSTTQKCCSNLNVLYNPKTHKCCQYGLVRIGIEECCDSTKSVVNKGQCPVYCQGGNTPRTPGDSCCGPNPYVKSTTADCCNSEIYNPSQNKCCNDASKRLVIMPGPEDGNCPAYCAGQLLPSGMECCTHNGKDIAPKPSGTCGNFCWDESNVNGNNGVGVAGPCKYPLGFGVGG